MRGNSNGAVAIRRRCLFSQKSLDASFRWHDGRYSAGNMPDAPMSVPSSSIDTGLHGRRWQAGLIGPLAVRDGARRPRAPCLE